MVEGGGGLFGETAFDGVFANKDAAEGVVRRVAGMDDYVIRFGEDALSATFRQRVSEIGCGDRKG